MNLAIRGIEGQIAHGDTFHNDRHPDLKADFILANPPFNVSDWGGERIREDKRWQYGVPAARNANFAWVQHIVHHLAPAGMAGFVLANGSMSSNQSGEGEIRKKLIDSVDDAHGMIRIFEVEFRPSEILFQMEPESYRVYLAEFDAEAESAESGTAEAAP